MPNLEFASFSKLVAQQLSYGNVGGISCLSWCHFRKNAKLGVCFLLQNSGTASFLYKRWAEYLASAGAIVTFCERPRDKNLYKSCILFTEFNSPPNLVSDKGIYSTRAGSILTSAGPAWDLRVQLMEHEGEDR